MIPFPSHAGPPPSWWSGLHERGGESAGMCTSIWIYPSHLFRCAFKLSRAGGRGVRCDDRMDMHAKALQWWWIVPHHLSTEACYIPHDFLRCYISSLQLRSAFFTPFFRSGYGGSIFYYKRALAALFTAWIIPFIVEWFFFLSDPHVLYYYYNCKFVLQEIRGSGVV